MVTEMTDANDKSDIVQVDSYDIEVSKLNPDYRFDTFFAGKSNMDALNAAKIASSFPGGPYNPLFIYGASCLGKTHLLHAAARYIAEHDPDTDILCSSARTLADRLVEAAERGTVHLLRGRIQKSDVLIIDDIQYMMCQDAVQEVFMDIVGDMYENKKQVVIAGDYAATEMMGLDIRLKERFAACLAAEINPLEYETKKTALLNLANKLGLDMTHDTIEIIDYIANISYVSLSEAYAALKRIYSYALFRGEPITVNNARHILEPISEKGKL